MRIIVTAGPTREHIDTVRFITNASSGRMGCAVASAAARAGHDVTLLLGPGCPEPQGAAGEGCRVVRFVSVADLKAALGERFPRCDALVMAAAPGDFRPETKAGAKLHRSDGPLLLRLVPTEDILAGLGVGKRQGQTVVAFAVEEGSPQEVEAAARGKLRAKRADYIVVNMPEAIGAAESRACILCQAGVALPWGDRTKEALAEEIVNLIASAGRGA